MQPMVTLDLNTAVSIATGQMDMQLKATVSHESLVWRSCPAGLLFRPLRIACP